MEKLEQALQDKLDQRKEVSSYRSMVVNTDLVDFCSNDYLGYARLLAEYPINKYNRVGATGSRLISGNSLKIEKLESEIAQFHNAESALLFNSGFDANLGILGCIASRHDTIIYDELSHASIRDGIKLSLGKSFSFNHNDVKDLELKIQRASGQVIIVVESIYSMDGDCCPLTEIVEVCQKYNAALMVDEAHGLGTVGANGEGLVVHHKLEDKVFARIYTYGKSMGGHGAVVVGSSVLKNYLINYARSFIYTTAMPFHTVDVIRNAYELLKNRKAINQLKSNIQLFKRHLYQSVSSKFIDSNTPIQSLVIGNTAQAIELAKKIQEADFFIKAILAPTVPKGEERLRICIHAFNTEVEIKRLCAVLNENIK